ncbi:hypothetical protein, partial [Mycolicibacterium litorale]
GRPGRGAGRGAPGRGEGPGRGPAPGTGRGVATSLTSDVAPGSLVVIFCSSILRAVDPRTAAQRGALAC